MSFIKYNKNTVLIQNVSDFQKINNNTKELTICFIKNLYLPENLPISIIKINVRSSNIIDLSNLPSNLQELCCADCHLENDQFKNLPKGLKKLDCSANKLITELLELPDNLEYLNCSGCDKLVKIKLPPNLKFLDCKFNNFTNIELPNSLEEIDCINCPKLKTINAENTVLKKITYNGCNFTDNPTLPNTLEEIIIGNKIPHFNSSPKNLKRIVVYNRCNEIDTDIPQNLINIINDSELTINEKIIRLDWIF